jgi:hypothetical protein
MCCYIFSWTCVLSCSAAFLDEATGSWTMIFHPASSSESVPQQFLDLCYWESECSEDSSRSKPITGGERKCNACGERGQFANQCPNPRTHPPQIAVSTPTPTHGANSVHVANKQNYVREKVNHVAVEEAQEAPDVVIGMFSSMKLLQLCCVILEHHILSYPLHMLRSIICP